MISHRFQGSGQSRRKKKGHGLMLDNFRRIVYDKGSDVCHEVWISDTIAFCHDIST